MIITKEMYNYIVSLANSENCEIGGILGSSKDGVITDVVSDVSTETIKCRCEYYPNIAFLNGEIEKWAQEDKAFWGIFHTHFAGSRVLSLADKEYVNKIMYSAREIVDYLYFPVYTLPDQVLTVYKAFFENGEITIVQDSLNIV